MCVILACDKEFPKLSTLKSCEIMNSDGGGIAWNELDKNNNVQTFFRKGMKATQIHALIKSGVVKLPCVIHFRISTVGESIPELTHPFVISKTSRLDLKGKIDYENEDGVLFHNGTVSEYKKILQESIIASNSKMLKGDYSDSRIMAFVSSLYGHEFLKLVEGWNKFCVLDKTGIHKYGNWVNIEKGIQGSNDYFQNTISYGNAYQDDYGEDFMYGGRAYSKGQTYRHSSYSAKEIDKEIDSAQDELSGLDDKDEIALLKEFNSEAVKRTRKSILEQVETYNQLNKSKSRKKMIDFLKSSGWGSPEAMSNKNLRRNCKREYETLQTKLKCLPKKKDKSPILNSDDYESLFESQKNEHWINEMKENPEFYTPRC